MLLSNRTLRVPLYNTYIHDRLVVFWLCAAVKATLESKWERDACIIYPIILSFMCVILYIVKHALLTHLFYAINLYCIGRVILMVLCCCCFVINARAHNKNFTNRRRAYLLLVMCYCAWMVNCVVQPASCSVQVCSVMVKDRQDYCGGDSNQENSMMTLHSGGTIHLYLSEL